MNSEEIKSYLSNIEESLFDEKRIVTFSWLSKTFGIHCNASKQLLYTFFENSPKKEELSVTYLLIGLPKDGDSRQVLIVKDKDLQAAEDSLKSITSKHIFSIQKCQDLSDINVLYSPPTDESVDVISKGVSAIDFNNKERDNALIAKLRHNALPAAPTPPAATAKKANIQPVTKTKSPVNNTQNEESNKGQNGTESKSENKKSVIPSMFKNTTGPKKKQAEKAVANVKKPQGIGAFFTKAANKPSPSNEPKKVPESQEIKKEEPAPKETNNKVKERLSPLKENKATLNICTESKNKKEESPKEKETAVKAKKVENKQKSTSKKASNKTSKTKVVKKGDKDLKKRKRLVVLSDSDSNSGSEAEEEVTREPTPEPVPIFIPDEDMDDVILGTPEPSKRNKKRKLVSKTFASSDGFMVTEKHYEDVSASEEEEEEQVPEKKFKGSSPQDYASNKSVGKLTEKKESPNIKNPSPQKTKQSSLMSFFKKK